MLLLCVVNLIIAGLIGTVADSNRPIRVLIVDGFSNHDWRHNTRLIRSVLDATGQFEISVSTAPAGKEPEARGRWRPKFSDYDVVIQTCNDIGGGPTWPDEVKQAFEQYVRQGGGVFMFHSANNAFASWQAYNEMIGLGWRKADFGWALEVSGDGRIIRIPPGEGGNTGHGKRVDAVIHRRGDHPIHSGLPRQWMAADTEIYRFARGPAKNLEVISYARDPRTGKNWPMEWITRYGDGRVYNSTFGHVWRNDAQPLGMRCAGFQTVLARACQWLAKREVERSLPNDFPTGKAVSLRIEFGADARME